MKFKLNFKIKSIAELIASIMEIKFFFLQTTSFHSLLIFIFQQKKIPPNEPEKCFFLLNIPPSFRLYPPFTLIRNGTNFKIENKKAKLIENSNGHSMCTMWLNSVVKWIWSERIYLSLKWYIIQLVMMVLYRIFSPHFLWHFWFRQCMELASNLISFKLIKLSFGQFSLSIFLFIKTNSYTPTIDYAIS